MRELHADGFQLCSDKVTAESKNFQVLQSNNSLEFPSGIPGHNDQTQAHQEWTVQNPRLLGPMADASPKLLANDLEKVNYSRGQLSGSSLMLPVRMHDKDSAQWRHDEVNEYNMNSLTEGPSPHNQGEHHRERNKVKQIDSADSIGRLASVQPMIDKIAIRFNKDPKRKARNVTNHRLIESIVQRHHSKETASLVRAEESHGITLAKSDNPNTGVSLDEGARRNTAKQREEASSLPAKEAPAPSISNKCSMKDSIVAQQTTIQEAVFDEARSQTSLLINKTSRLNQRLMRGPGGAASNVVGSLAQTAEQEKSAVIPSQRRVSYLVNHPTANEISHSRLVENSLARTSHAALHGSQEVKGRLHSAIHQGCLRTSYRYDAKTGKHGQHGGLVYVDAAFRAQADNSGLASTHDLVSQAREPNPLQLGSATFGSTALKHSQASGAPPVATEQASNFERALNSNVVLSNLQNSDVGELLNDRTSLVGKLQAEQHDRARPHTAKVGGVFSNLKSQNSNKLMGMNYAKPGRIESAHQTGLQRLNNTRDPSKIRNSSSHNFFQSTNCASNVGNVKKEVPQSTNKTSALHCVSISARNTLCYASNNSAKNSSLHTLNRIANTQQQFYHRNLASEENSNADLHQYGVMANDGQPELRSAASTVLSNMKKMNPNY